MKKQSFIGNLLYAFGAQGISLILSVLMSMIVPKLLGVEDYSYWQLFVFYIGYVGFSQFGLTDGVYLRIGGCNYEEIDHSKYKTQYAISFAVQIFIALIIVFIASIFGFESKRMYVLIWSMVYMLVLNSTGYLGYIFQAVNQTRAYSISVMIDKIVFIFWVIVAIIYRSFDFRYYIIGYTISKTAALLYCLVVAKELVLAKICVSLEVIKDMLLSISIGAKLLFANIASSLILGIGRQIIDSAWGITAFGRFSFSLSLTSFFLQFTGQVSMVLFPALRQTNNDKQNAVYSALRDALGLFLPVIFLAYYPMQIVFGAWLPEYKESLQYLAILLPLCTYDGKMQMLCNTYFKVLRKENFLLGINVISALVSLVLSSVSAFILHNVNGVAYAMVFAVAVRSVVSEIYLSRIQNKNILDSVIAESIIVILFLGLMENLSAGVGSLIFMAAYIAFLVVNRNKIINLAHIISPKLKR